MEKIILIYLGGVVGAIFLTVDFYFLAFLFLTLATFFLTLRVYKGHSIFIKDIAIYCIYFAVFACSALYTNTFISPVSYSPSENSIYKIEGEIVSMKQLNKQQELLVRVGEIRNLNTGLMEIAPKSYLSVNVSPYKQYELFDSIKVVGEIDLKVYDKYLEQRPLIFNYQYVNLTPNSVYEVSGLKKIEKFDSQKSFYETKVNNFFRLSENIKKRISEYMNEPYASIAEGISVGERDNLEKDIKDIFKTSGLYHILVLSGANIAFVVSLIWFGLRRTKNKYLKVFLAIFFSWIFILGTGLSAPSVRAGVMSTSNILSELLQKYLSPMYGLLFALFILTIFNPLSLVYNSSLHLSFLACFGLFILAPKIQKIIYQKTEIYFKKKLNFFSFLVANILGVFICVTPYLLALTGSASIFGGLLLIVVEPLTYLSTIFSFLIILTSFINFYIATFFGILNTLVVETILSIAFFGSNYLPQIYFKIGPLFLIIYYFLVFTFFVSEQKVLSPKFWYNIEK